MDSVKKEDKVEIRQLIKKRAYVSARSGNPKSSYNTVVKVVYRIKGTDEVLYKTTTRDGPYCLSRGTLVGYGESGVSVSQNSNLSKVKEITESRAEEIMNGSVLPVL